MKPRGSDSGGSKRITPPPLIRDEEPPAPAPSKHPLMLQLEALMAVLDASLERLSKMASDLQEKLDRFVAQFGETFKRVADVVSRNVSRAPLWKDTTLWACAFRGELAPIPVEAPRACPISLRVAESHRTGWPAR